MNSVAELTLNTATLNYSLVKDNIDPVIRYLSDHGAVVNVKDKYGLTPLHYACMRGDIKASLKTLFKLIKNN